MELANKVLVFKAARESPVDFDYRIVFIGYVDTKFAWGIIFFYVAPIDE
jgi:hypothetical protein